MKTTLYAAMATCLFACAEEETPKDPGLAGMRDGKYVNDFFGVALPIPEDWHVASQETAQFVEEFGEEMFAGDDALLRTAMKASEKTTWNLLLASEFEMGAPVPFNPNLILLAENLAHAPGVESGEDYLYHTVQLLQRSRMSYTVTNESHAVELGGATWHRVDLVLEEIGISIQQSFIARKQKGFALVMILSGSTEADMEELNRFAAAIELR